MTLDSLRRTVGLLFAGSGGCLFVAGTSLLLPGALAAQLSAKPAVTQAQPAATAQAKPPTIIRPSERGESLWRGVPWSEDPNEALPVSSPVARAGTATRPQAAGSGGVQLKVSGWWMIDVKNGDGTVAVHREVENTYAVSPFLVYLLAGKITTGEPMISFITSGSGSSAVSPCVGTTGCEISEMPGGFWASQPNCTQNPSSCSTNLTPSISSVAFSYQGNCTSFGGCIGVNETLPAFELNGSIVAQVSNIITHLESHFAACSESAATNTSSTTALSPAACIPFVFGNTSVVASEYVLTALDLGNPIPVMAGQVVSIKLDLSFSAQPYQ